MALIVRRNKTYFSVLNLQVKQFLCGAQKTYSMSTTGFLYSGEEFSVAEQTSMID